MNALWSRIAEAVMQPVFGDLTGRLGLGGDLGQSYVDKDLRTLLHHRVRGAFNLRYCGEGSLDACRATLWGVVGAVASELAAAQGSDPTAWRSTARRQGFTPGLIPDTIRATNRPTFQQVLEFARPVHDDRHDDHDRGHPRWHDDRDHDDRDHDDHHRRGHGDRRDGHGRRSWDDWRSRRC
jgi:hypothetical protein